ncbi:MAG: hypothetical protein HY337_02785 [Gemmatimonadetes bacterium]|jgi:hypothetical protein|nr:hypothetical protein [Gemmatimonadota bacterium]
MSEKTGSSGRLRFGRTNAVLLGAAVISLGAGYYLLNGGSTALAPVLLVLGYCVLFPLGLAL